ARGRRRTDPSCRPAPAAAALAARHEPPRLRRAATRRPVIGPPSLPGPAASRLRSATRTSRPAPAAALRRPSPPASRRALGQRLAHRCQLAARDRDPFVRWRDTNRPAFVAFGIAAVLERAPRALG